MAQSVIHLRVPSALKDRWIRASRTAGMRLTDWIVNAVEAHMKQQIARVTIPDDLQFADLKLARDPSGMVSFDWAPIERICSENNLSIDVLRDGSEDNISALIVAWYMAHRDAGGFIDPVQEDLITEILIEDAAGSESHQPGSA